MNVLSCREWDDRRKIGGEKLGYFSSERSKPEGGGSIYEVGNTSGEVLIGIYLREYVRGVRQKSFSRILRR